MNKLYGLVAGAWLLVLVGCTPEKRSAVGDALAKFSGADGSDAGQIAAEVGKDVGQKVATGDYVGAIAYVVAGIGVAVGALIAKRKLPALLKRKTDK